VAARQTPAGAGPSLGRNFAVAPLSRTFEESSRELPFVTQQSQRGSIVKGEIPPCQRGGTLVITTEMHKGAASVMTKDAGKHFSASGTLQGEPTDCHPVLGNATYPASWQAWRVLVEASAAPQNFQFLITHSTGFEIPMSRRAHFLPT
jgi:hypothetical protein